MQRTPMSLRTSRWKGYLSANINTFFIATLESTSAAVDNIKHNLNFEWRDAPTEVVHSGLIRVHESAPR